MINQYQVNDKTYLSPNDHCFSNLISNTKNVYYGFSHNSDTLNLMKERKIYNYTPLISLNSLIHLNINDKCIPLAIGVKTADNNYIVGSTNSNIEIPISIGVSIAGGIQLDFIFKGIVFDLDTKLPTIILDVSESDKNFLTENKLSHSLGYVDDLYVLLINKHKILEKEKINIIEKTITIPLFKILNENTMLITGIFEISKFFMQKYRNVRNPLFYVSDINADSEELIINSIRKLCINGYSYNCCVIHTSSSINGDSGVLDHMNMEEKKNELINTITIEEEIYNNTIKNTDLFMEYVIIWYYKLYHYINTHVPIMLYSDSIIDYIDLNVNNNSDFSSYKAMHEIKRAKLNEIRNHIPFVDRIFPNHFYPSNLKDSPTRNSYITSIPANDNLGQIIKPLLLMSDTQLVTDFSSSKIFTPVFIKNSTNKKNSGFKRFAISDSTFYEYCEKSIRNECLMIQARNSPTKTTSAFNVMSNGENDRRHYFFIPNEKETKSKMSKKLKNHYMNFSFSFSINRVFSYSRLEETMFLLRGFNSTNNSGYYANNSRLTDYNMCNIAVSFNPILSVNLIYPSKFINKMAYVANMNKGPYTSQQIYPMFNEMGLIDYDNVFRIDLKAGHNNVYVCLIDNLLVVSVSKLNEDKTHENISCIHIPINYYNDIIETLVTDISIQKLQNEISDISTTQIYSDCNKSPLAVYTTDNNFKLLTSVSILTSLSDGSYDLIPATEILYNKEMRNRNKGGGLPLLNSFQNKFDLMSSKHSFDWNTDTRENHPVLYLNCGSLYNKNALRPYNNKSNFTSLLCSVLFDDTGKVKNDSRRLKTTNVYNNKTSSTAAGFINSNYLDDDMIKTISARSSIFHDPENSLTSGYAGIDSYGNIIPSMANNFNQNVQFNNGENQEIYQEDNCMFMCDIMMNENVAKIIDIDNSNKYNDFTAEILKECLNAIRANITVIGRMNLKYKKILKINKNSTDWIISIEGVNGAGFGICIGRLTEHVNTRIDMKNEICFDKNKKEISVAGLNIEISDRLTTLHNRCYEDTLIDENIALSEDIYRVISCRILSTKTGGIIYTSVPLCIQKQVNGNTEFDNVNNNLMFYDLYQSKFTIQRSKDDLIISIFLCKNNNEILNYESDNILRKTLYLNNIFNRDNVGEIADYLQEIYLSLTPIEEKDTINTIYNNNQFAGMNNAANDINVQYSSININSIILHFNSLETGRYINLKLEYDNSNLYFLPIVPDKSNSEIEEEVSNSAAELDNGGCLKTNCINLDSSYDPKISYYKVNM